MGAIYLSVDTIFQSLWFLSGFDRGVLLTRKLLHQGFLSLKKLEVNSYASEG
jgi:hypothetical protein